MATDTQVWPPSIERTMIPFDPVAQMIVLLRWTTSATPRRLDATPVDCTVHQEPGGANRVRTQQTSVRMGLTVAGFLEVYFFSRGAGEITVRASGCLGLQSSGGKATRQKEGQASVNSRPISAFPERTGPKKTTWHSRSC